MSDPYQQTFAATDGQNNVTYIQFIPNQGNQILYCKEEEMQEDYLEEQEYEEEETVEETIEETYLEEDPATETFEVLESVVLERKKKKDPETSLVTKKLVQKNVKSKLRGFSCYKVKLNSFLLDSGKPKGRKRVIPDQTREIRKQRANTNKCYINAKGQEVKPKEFDETFMCTCPKQCTDPTKLSLKTRRQIFNMFWNIGSYEGRCAFLNSCINEAPKKRCYTKNKETSRRKMTRKYYLKGVEVCKTTFVKTLKISNSRVDVCLQKMETENFNDQRGRKKAHIGFTQERKELVIEHIKETYEPDASLRGMHARYLEANPSEPVSESYYKRMFYENFDLKVRKIVPKKEIKIEPVENAIRISGF
jgi:hypothetical protein